MNEIVRFEDHIGIVVNSKAGNRVSLVDIQDAEKALKLNWHLRKVTRGGQQYTSYAYSKHAGKAVSLHRFLLDLPTHFVDHINGDGLDNRRSNLRLVSHSENMRNCRKHCKSASRYKGVWYRKDRQRWIAQICVRGEKKYLGSFVNEEDAAHAYDTAAIRLHGEFAYTNKMEHRMG